MVIVVQIDVNARKKVENVVLNVMAAMVPNANIVN
jgi:hypothetical protein